MRDRKVEINMLQDTLQILEQGYYEKQGRRVNLKLSRKEMTKVQVLLPEDVRTYSNRPEFKPPFVRGGRCGHGCENMDSFALAGKRYQDCSYMFQHRDSKEILVLNLANPVHPGGGVRSGARAQEEDLCRKSSLLLSLESRSASRYYQYNEALHTYMGSDAMIFTPKVEIIRDENGELLDETVIVAVVTCAAPKVSFGKEGMSQEAYESMVYNRIMGMLKCSAYFGYKNLVLGAWGCGAFGNDAHVISDIFYKALKELEYNQRQEQDLFRRIDFAVLDRTEEQYNFKEFYRNFSFENFFRDENKQIAAEAMKRIKETEVHLDQIRGCLFGGAVGDALGYPIEFWDDDKIFSVYGVSGITEYKLDDMSGKALISDDTQMTLFTANGLLFGDTREAMRGVSGWPRYYAAASYQDWLHTQLISYEESRKQLPESPYGCVSWLVDVPELYNRRAPGNTCMSALLGHKKSKQHIEDFVCKPQNNSKGCGGMMRVAPLALKFHDIKMDKLDMEGAQIAAITHGHSLGYMTAAVLTHILNRIVFPEEQMSLREIVLEAEGTVAELFPDDKYLKKLEDIIELAVSLSENADTDINNINRIGEGWVAEETLGIAIYCALRHQNDFSSGVIAAVNHKGDSDSTGAVTGNILGAWLGYAAIEEKWKTNLELKDVILEMADDLCHGCQMSEFGHYEDPDWTRKYIYMQWRDEKPDRANQEGNRTVSEMVQSPDFYSINKLLRSGGIADAKE